MYVFLYVVIISFTYILVHGQWETTCDCSEIGILKETMKDILLENKMVTSRLRRLEARQNIASRSKTIIVSNGRLEKLEQKVGNIEMKFSNTSTTAKEKQMKFDRNIGAIMKKTLMSEKKERTQFVSSLNKRIIEHTESLETFKLAINNTIDQCFTNITAIQNEHSNNIKETLAVFEKLTADAFNNVLNNVTTFQENIIVDVNRRLDRIEQMDKSIQFIATDLNTVKQSISEIKSYITEALKEMVVVDRDSSIKVGDMVRVKPDITKPTHGWGKVTHRSVGTVKSIASDGRGMVVDFPEQTSWYGVLDEMEVIRTFLGMF